MDLSSATKAGQTSRDERPSLLLLPFPPSPSSRPLLSAAYRPPLAATLSQLRSTAGPEKLIIAIACPILHGQYRMSKAVSWSDAQALLAGVYTLVSVLCAELAIATELDAGPASVDTTVVLLDHSRETRFPEGSKFKIVTNSTVVVDLATFALAFHPWKSIFHVRSEPGLELFRTYLRLAEGRQPLLQRQLIPVEGGLVMNTAQTAPPVPMSPTPSYDIVCLGGTFDYLHPGHKLLLTAAALLLKVPDQGSSQQPCQFIIGVTGDELLKNKKFAEYVQPWTTRARNVLNFLSRILAVSAKGWAESSPAEIHEEDGDFRASFRDGTISVQCVRIRDAFGPTITLQEMDALVVSGETRSGGRAVNDRREEKGWRPLDVYEVDVLDVEQTADECQHMASETFASKISSSAIRQQRAQATS